MELDRLFEELLRAAERAGVTVREETFDPALAAMAEGRRVRGGFCRLRGRAVILLDRDASLADRIATLAAGLAKVDLEHLFLPPLVRATIRSYARGPGPRAAGPPLPLHRVRRFPRA